MKTKLILNAFIAAEKERQTFRVELPKDVKGNKYYLSSFYGRDNMYSISFSMYSQDKYIPLLTTGYVGGLVIGNLIDYIYRYYKLIQGISSEDIDMAIEENEYIIKYNKIYNRKYCLKYCSQDEF